jgi:hypothetical protein
MKKILQSLYVKTDTTCTELSKAGLLQIILKIVYSYNSQITRAELLGEIRGILDTLVGEQLLEEALTTLTDEGKIKDSKSKISLSSTIQKKFDIAHAAYKERQSRIYESYFSKASSTEDAIENWFENITIKFFTKFRGEWIAEKAYKAKVQSPYEGLKKLIKQETAKDENIDTPDKEWLCNQYLIFFNSNDSDLDSVFWDYGTAAYTSSLIKSSTTSNQVTVNLIKDSKFVLDTNILMHLPLEAGDYYTSYKALAEVFEKLNIKPGYFYISRDEYINSVARKKEQILKVIDNYEDEIIEDIKGDFIRTAKARMCKTTEDFETFFDTLIDPPSHFINGLKMEVFDSPQLQEVFEKAKEDEALKIELNSIFTNRQKKFLAKTKNTSDKKKEQKIRNKKPGALNHDAGLIRGTEYLKSENEKCFILTRDITVKQYGINTSNRDEASISIGLDTLISLLAINDGGLDMNPDNFKPLFAKIIKLSLLPERNTIRPEDLARLLDIEQDIARLPHDAVVAIVNEAHSLQIKGESKEFISTTITRSFQRVKMNLKSDLETTKSEVELERSKKDEFKEKHDKKESALRSSFQLEIESRDKKWLNKQYRNILWITLGTMAITYVVYLIIGNKDWKTIEGPTTGILINLAGALIISYFVIIPKIKKKYKDKTANMRNEIDKKIMDLE